MDGGRKHLLDSLAERCGKNISDLRLCQECKKEAYCRLMEIPEGFCSVREWNETLAYLSGIYRNYRNIRTARAVAGMYFNAMDRKESSERKRGTLEEILMNLKDGQIVEITVWEKKDA